MATLAPTQNSNSVSILVQYRAHRSDLPVYVASNASDWVPEKMGQVADSNTHEGTLFQHTIQVPRDYSAVVYKFRVGDGEWVFNHDSPTEPDGFWGMNNRFDIPRNLPPTPPPDTPSASLSSLPAHDKAAHESSSTPQHTALPSPTASPRLHEHDTDSGTELEAPSVSDWEPTSEAGGDDVLRLDEEEAAAADSEVSSTPPPPSTTTTSTQVVLLMQKIGLLGIAAFSALVVGLVWRFG